MAESEARITKKTWLLQAIDRIEDGEPIEVYEAAVGGQALDAEMGEIVFKAREDLPRPDDFPIGDTAVTNTFHGEDAYDVTFRCIEIDSYANESSEEERTRSVLYLRASGVKAAAGAYGPKLDNDPSIGQDCAACGIPFYEGDYSTAVALGPGNDPIEMQKCAQGSPYNAVAVEVHYHCANGLTPQQGQAR